jgi:glycerol kinase
MKPLLGAIDNGTTSTRFIVFDQNANIIASSQKEYTQYYPLPGYCEHDIMELYEKTVECMNQVSDLLVEKGYHVQDIKSIGITNQRETTCVWSRSTGKPLYNALVWLDTRTRDLVHEMIEKTPTKSSHYFQSRTGLPISTYFSALKLKWLLSNVPKIKEASEKDDIMFGTIDTWLLYKLTNGKQHMTDVTNASRTLLMNLQTCDWDPECLDFFEIKKSMLPSIKSSSEIYGFVELGLYKGIPIGGILGDQQSALVGQACFQKGELKNTYGTGCFMLCNTGTEPILSSHGLLTTVGYQLGPNQPIVYALEGSIAIAGAAITWLRDNLGIITESRQVGDYASKVPDTGGIYFVPAFSGIPFP